MPVRSVWASTFNRGYRSIAGTVTASGAGLSAWTSDGVNITGDRIPGYQTVFLIRRHWSSGCWVSSIEHVRLHTIDDPSGCAEFLATEKSFLWRCGHLPARWCGSSRWDWRCSIAVCVISEDWRLLKVLDPTWRGMDNILSWHTADPEDVAVIATWRLEHPSECKILGVHDCLFQEVCAHLEEVVDQEE